MVESDDSSLIERVRHGDVSAYAEVIDRYQRVIFTVALRMVKHREDARDIAQAVFVKAYQHIDSFDGSRRFFSWLYRIAVNESLNHLNRTRTHELLDPETLSDAPGPAELREASRLSETVEAALMKLAPDYRVAIVLRHFLDLSYSEMSEVLLVPEKTVKSRLFTARRMLGGILIKKGIAYR